MYLLSIAEIVNSVQQNGAETLLIVHNYILGLILGTESINVYVSQSKDEKDKLLTSATAAKNWCIVVTVKITLDQFITMLTFGFITYLLKLWGELFSLINIHKMVRY